MRTFLNEVLENLLSDPKHLIPETTFVLPSKRAGGFLRHLLQQHVDKTIFAPDIWSIEDFITEITGLTILDNTNTLFAFYDIYKNLTPKNEQEEFDVFYGWAQTLIYDFNEIDRHLVDTTAFFNYLADIKDIEHWSLQAHKTELVENYLKFWNKLPDYHHRFTETLLKRKEAYQGLAYREAAGEIDNFLNNHANRLVFIGFNALNKAEQKIIQQALEKENTRVFWDIDEIFLEDKSHDAGYFMRQYRREWAYYAKEKNPFEWIGHNFKTPKDIRLIGIPKNIGQATYAGQLLQHENTSGTALVLNDENLLSPVLNALPASVNQLNITMGLGLAQTPLASLIEILFKIQFDPKNKLYYKNVLDLLNHPAIRLAIGEAAQSLQDEIVSNNLVFIKPEELLLSEDPIAQQVIKACFTSYRNNATAFLEALIKLMHKLRPDPADFPMETEYLFHFNKVFHKLHNLFSHYQTNINIKSLHRLYKDILQTESLDFEGSPFEGVQLMGMLETRVLDFDTVILTSVNEGILPAGKSENSFIPYDLKKQYGLPTYKEKDAVYTYHFYRLLQRAKKVYLLYNTDKSGLNAGEKSRFLTQLEMEYAAMHPIKQTYIGPKLISPKTDLEEIPKTPQVIKRLRRIAQKGFSPSALTNYIRNPLDFYKQYILNISDRDEVEETVAANTLGTVIHNTLENFYKPLEGQFLTEGHLEKMSGSIASEVGRQFETTYRNAPLNEGKNLIIYEIAKRYVFNFLQKEKELIKDHRLKILHIENGELHQKLNFPDFDFPVFLRGRVDRVDQLDDHIRVVDYKTGAVEPRDLRLPNWDLLTREYKYSKAFQVLCYSLLIKDQLPETALKAGIICLKKLGNGFMDFQDKSGKKPITQIDEEMMSLFTDELNRIITEIFEESIPFEEKELNHASY